MWWIALNNISELIGIMKGINFDGSVNCAERNYLSLWIDKNRNIICDPQQLELIKMIESVLKDDDFKEENRMELIKSAEKLTDKSKGKFLKIYELNGIVKGIICDKDINKLELNNLRKWIEYNKEYFKGNVYGKDLITELDEILRDKVVTKEKQDILLEMLSKTIKKSEFYVKLKSLCKKVKERKNIGIDLIRILDDEDSIEEIHLRAENQLKAALSSYSSSIENSEIIVVSLVLIAMLEYDGNYYENVRKTYKNIYNQNSQQKVEGCIRKILDRYNKRSHSSDRKRIINVALENSIVPKIFLPDFFDFIYDIYKLNFECELPTNLNDEFNFVYDDLYENRRSGKDSISIKITNKTYKLIETTKELIRYRDGLEELINLSIIVVKLIDKCYWGEDVKVLNPYLKYGYEKWFNKVSETGSIKNRKREKCYKKNRWKPQFININEKVYIKPPTHKVKSKFDYRDIEVVVSNGDKILYSNKSCDIREIIGGYQVRVENIELDKPLGEVVYRIVAGDEEIYNSEEKLYRNFIVFDECGNEIFNNEDYEGTVYVCSQEENEKSNKITENYSITEYWVTIGDIIKVGNSIFSFSEIDKPVIMGDLHKNCKLSELNTEKLIPVYKQVRTLIFEVENDFSNIEIVINGQRKKLNTTKHRIFQKESTRKYSVELELKKSGIYCIEVNQYINGKKNKILSETFAYDMNLDYSKLEECIDGKSFKIDVLSDLIGKRINMNISAQTIDENDIVFSYDNKKYRYLIPFDLGFYKISDSFCYSKEDDIWIEDVEINSVLKIYNSSYNGLSVYDEAGYLVEEDIKLEDKGYYKCVQISFLNSYKQRNKYVTLVFTENGKAKQIIKCYNKCVIDSMKTEIDFLDNPKRIKVKPYFRGKNKVFYEMLDLEGRKIYTSRPLSSGEEDYIYEFESFTKYVICFYEEKKGFLQLIKQEPIYKVEKEFYAKEDFVGKEFKISEVYFNQIYNKKLIEKQWYFNKVFVRITDSVNVLEGKFKGRIFIRKNIGIYPLNNINPVDIEICSEEINGTMDIYITNQGDGLLFDLDKRGIMNWLEHKTAPDIFLYTIKLKGELS